MRNHLVLATAFFLVCACGARPMSMGGNVSRGELDATASEKHKALVAEGDTLWKERLDEAKLRTAIAKWNEAVQIKTDDHATYLRLTRGYYLLADGHLSMQDGKADEYLSVHEQGLAVAEKGLMAISPDFEKRRQAGTKFETASGVLGRDAVPLLYWYASNLGKWAKKKGISTTLKYKDLIFGTITRVYELDENYFYGAPDRYFGGYYSVAPKFAGGDLGKSQEYFAKSVKKAPYYLATHVLIADYLATKKQDRALFEKELKFVLDTPADAIPELAPEHEIEKKKAKRLMAEIDERF